MSMDKIKYFASLDENGIVENYSTINYSHSVIEYSVDDQSVTKNAASIGAKYDLELNAFIPPKEEWVDDTWIFNSETLTWDPDPNIIYYHIENIPHRWNPETREWYRIEE
jgi:hypothetical protein